MSIISYLGETKGELKHVNWPTRRQVVAATALVIVFSAVVGVLLGAFDIVFNFLLKLIV